MIFLATVVQIAFVVFINWAWSKMTGENKINDNFYDGSESPRINKNLSIKIQFNDRILSMQVCVYLQAPLSSRASQTGSSHENPLLSAI